jgi:putative nucleotidyltransferase with HDIG domain
MSANTDLKFSDKSFRYESADRPAPPSPRGRWLAIRARRAMNLLERQRWFLPATTLVFLIAAVQIVTSSLPAPLGAGAILGSILLVGFLLATFYTYIRALQPKHVAQPRSLLCIGAVLLIVLLLARYGLTVVTALHASFPHLSLSAMRAALPIPLGGILLTVLFNARLAFAGSLSLTILVSLMLEAPLSYFLYTFVGSAVGIFALSRQQQRSAIFRAGGAVALANTYAALALALLEGRTAGLFADILGGWICGLMAAVLTTGLLPLLEHPFERTTVFTLLELSDHNHPLLKHMLFAAPGTYHHSLMVGTLAEAAAEAVGANALLCRVGAYYHDIGKTRHPQYFVENEANAADRHTKLAPSLSRAIVMSHVKEGIEMAREYGLPEALVDMIPQHRGVGGSCPPTPRDAPGELLLPAGQGDGRPRTAGGQGRGLPLSRPAPADARGGHPDAGGRGPGRHPDAHRPHPRPHPRRGAEAHQQRVRGRAVRRMRSHPARSAPHREQLCPGPYRLLPPAHRIPRGGPGGAGEEASREWRSASKTANGRFASRRRG